MDDKLLQVFQSRGDFVGLVQFDKRFNQKHKKIGCHRQNTCEIFLLATFKTTF